MANEQVTVGRDMRWAPRDGKRVLIRTRLYFYSRQTNGFAPGGTRWIEAWFKDGRFQEWCGCPEIRSSETLHPIEWLPAPGDPA